VRCCHDEFGSRLEKIILVAIWSDIEPLGGTQQGPVVGQWVFAVLFTLLSFAGVVMAFLGSFFVPWFDLMTLQSLRKERVEEVKLLSEGESD
jgi:hypothetical protein